MACRSAHLMIYEDLWSASALVKALVELVFSVLVLLSSLLLFLTVTFGQTFNLRRPAFWESRRPEKRGGGKADVTVLCEHHAKQISSLKSSFSHIAVGMTTLCELCALSLVYCSCKKPDSGLDNRNLDTSIAVQHTRASADQGIQPGTHVTDSSTSKGSEFDGNDGLVLSSMKNNVWNNKIRHNAGNSEFAMCPTCGLVVMAEPYENRSVKRKFARVSADELRLSCAERGSKWENSAMPVEYSNMSSLDVDQKNTVSWQGKQRNSEDVMHEDFDQLCRYRGQGSLSPSSSLRVGRRMSTGREGSIADASDLELESSSLGLDPEGEDGTRNLSSKANALSALYIELEEERNASATAASEAMAMITRLQEEKAMIQMEARHYQRMVEEKSVYDQEAISLLQEILARKDEELTALASEVKIYRRKLLAGIWTDERESTLGKDVYDQSLRLQHEGKKLVFSDTGHRRRPSATVDTIGDDTSQLIFEPTEGSGLAPQVEDVSNAHSRDPEFMDTIENESFNWELATESNVQKDGKENMDLVVSGEQSHLNLPFVQNATDCVCASQDVAGSVMEVPNVAAEKVTAAPSAAGNSGTIVDEKSATQSTTLPDDQFNKEVRKSVQTANEIVRSRERFLDALKSSATISLLEEERDSGQVVEGTAAEKATKDAETARNIVLEEHRLSVLEYVRKFEGQSRWKQASQLGRGSSFGGGSRLAQKEEQLSGKVEARQPVEQEPHTALVAPDHVDSPQGCTEQLPEKAEVPDEKLNDLQKIQELGIKVSSDVIHEENAVCWNTSLGEDVDELGWKNDGAESPVLDVYEVSSGYATDHRPDAQRLVSYSQLDGRVSEPSRARSSRKSRAHDSGNRLGKPDAHPEVLCGHGKDRVLSRTQDFTRQNNEDLEVSGMQPEFDSETSYAIHGSDISHGVRPVMYGTENHGDWRTPSMVSRDAYRAIMEEEALCLISRLEAVEADRQAMRQTIESLRRENGEMKLLQEIAQQLREMRGVEKKSIKTQEHWQEEDPSSASLFKGMLSFTRLRCTVQAQLTKIARLFLRSGDTGASPGDQLGLRLLQNSAQPPVATCITRGVKVDSSIKGPSISGTTREAGTASGQTSLTALLLSEAQARPGDSWIVDAKGRHGTALGGWYY